MVKENSLAWTNERHSDVIFMLKGSYPPTYFTNGFKDAIDCEAFWRIFNSERFTSSEIEKVLEVLQRTLSFLHYELKFEGIENLDGLMVVLYEDYWKHLSFLHANLVALFSKLLQFPIFVDRIRHFLWNQLCSKTVVDDEDTVRSFSVYELLQLSIEKDLLRDTETLQSWCTTLADSKFYIRTLAEYPCLAKGRGIFRHHSILSGVYDTVWLNIVNSFQEAHQVDYCRPGAAMDQQNIEKVSQRSRDIRLNFIDLSRDELVRRLRAGVTKQILKHTRTICLAMSSHGEGSEFVCNDDVNIGYDELFDIIKGMAPNLERILVMLQACQGSQLRKAHVSSEVDVDSVTWQENLQIKDSFREGMEVYLLRSTLASHYAASSRCGSFLFRYLEATSNTGKREWIPPEELLEQTMDQFKELVIKSDQDDYVIRPVLEYLPPHSAAPELAP